MAVNGNGTHIGALPTNKGVAAAVEIEAGGGSKRGSWLQLGGSSKRHMLADRAATGLDRTATGLAAAAPGASRWGASYWTQVRGLGSYWYNCCLLGVWALPLPCTSSARCPSAAHSKSQVSKSCTLPLLPPCPQFSTLFIRAVRVRRFETLSRQDFFQFVTVGLVCGMIW